MSAPESRKLGDPSTAEWRAALGLPPLTENTLSTSARLRQVQADLAASQADLTRAERERDRFIAAADKLHGEWLDLKAELASARQELALLRAELDAAREHITVLDHGEAIDDQLRARFTKPDNQTGATA